MHNRFIISISFLLALLFTVPGRLHAEENYTVIAEATIPGLIESAQSISRFSDQVSPGSSLILAGGVIALSFQLHDIILSSDLRILLYADSSGKNPAPLIAFIANPAGSKTTSKIKFNKFNFPSKKIGDKIFIAENSNLLNAIKALPPELKTDKDLIIKIYPEKYITLCKGTIPAFQAKMEQEFSKGRKPKKIKQSKDLKNLESLINQYETVTIKFEADSELMDLNLSILPKPSSVMAETLQNINGPLSQKDIIDLSKKVAKSQNALITDEIVNALSFILSKIFDNSNTDLIAQKLCKFNISSDRSELNLNIAITPQQAKEILSLTGVIKKK